MPYWSFWLCMVGTPIISDLAWPCPAIDNCGKGTAMTIYRHGLLYLVFDYFSGWYLTLKIGHAWYLNKNNKWFGVWVNMHQNRCCYYWRSMCAFIYYCKQFSAFFAIEISFPIWEHFLIATIFQYCAWILATVTTKQADAWK